MTRRPFVSVETSRVLATDVAPFGAAPFVEQRLPAQANLAGRVDVVDDLDQNLFAFLQLVTHILHAVVLRSRRRGADRRCPA